MVWVYGILAVILTFVVAPALGSALERDWKAHRDLCIGAAAVCIPALCLVMYLNWLYAS